MKLFHSIPKSTLYVAISCITAVVIVLGGLTLRASVLESSLLRNKEPEAALNDTRSPLADENSSQAAIKPSPDIIPGRVPKPIPVPSGTDSTFNLPDESAYPQEDLGEQSVGSLGAGAIAGAPKIPSAGISGDAFNHLPYAENNPARLESVGSFVRESYERAESLDFEAVQSFANMRAAAAAEGINIMPISGFRTFADQAQLFENQVERKGSEAEAARYSAPPGHSEHHTGYAIDIADADQPNTDIKYSFENTAAYRWLKTNAYAYGFEESFPKGNTQGVTFEPWHWRYFGSERAEQIFAPARTYFPAG